MSLGTHAVDLSLWATCFLPHRSVSLPHLHTGSSQFGAPHCPCPNRPSLTLLLCSVKHCGCHRGHTHLCGSLEASPGLSKPRMVTASRVSNCWIPITEIIQISQGTFQTLHYQPGNVSRWGSVQALLAVSLGSKNPQAMVSNPNASTYGLLPSPLCLAQSQNQSSRGRTVLEMEQPAPIAATQQRGLGGTSGTSESHSKLGTVPKVIASSSFKPQALGCLLHCLQEVSNCLSPV